MRIDRSRITDASGRHIPVRRAPIATREPDDDEATPPLLLNRDRHIRQELDRLSGRVRRLAPPDRHEPAKFHEDRSEIARALQRLAALMDR